MPFQLRRIRQIISKKIYSELDKDNFIFKVGQYPGHCRTGEKYTIRQCLVYGYETGQKVQATFVFNITIE